MSTGDYMKTMTPVETLSAPVRKRDAARTKADILQAAKEAFSSLGYATTGVREIASRSGITAALVLRYFGSKEALFEAALSETLDPQHLLAGGRENFGRHAAEVLSGPRSGIDSAAMMILALSDEKAREISTRLIDGITHRALAKWIGPPEAADRAAQISVL